MPEETQRIKGHVFPSEEMLIFARTFLFRGETFIDMVDKFGGDVNT
jgi:hypothetical protein